MATKQDVYRRQATATRVLNTEIRKEIIRQDAIDTTRMRNVTKIIKLKWNDVTDDITFEIDTTFYYKFVDKGFSKKWFNGRKRRNLTDAFLKREKVKEQIEKLVAVIFEYRIDEQFK
jgi:hypothetical protein